MDNQTINFVTWFVLAGVYICTVKGQQSMFNYGVWFLLCIFAGHLVALTK